MPRNLKVQINDSVTTRENRLVKGVIKLFIQLTTLDNPKYAVGPNGKWQTTKPSGLPRCSCTKMTSVKSLLRAASMISEITCQEKKGQTKTA